MFGDPASYSPERRTKEPRRFISSILGGDIPYGSQRGHVITQAERKLYLPVAEEKKKKDDKPLIKEEKDPLENDPVVLPSRTSPTPESSPSPGVDNNVTCQKDCEIVYKSYLLYTILLYQVTYTEKKKK